MSLGYYHPQTKFAKVMFLQMSVCPYGGLLWGGCGCGWLLGGCSRGACVVALGGVVAPGGHALLLPGGAWLLPGGMCGCSGGGMHGCSGGAWLLRGAWLLWAVCMVAPRGGMRGCSWGAFVVAPRGACVVALGGHVWDTMRYGDTINERVVRILLECILVKDRLCQASKYLYHCPWGIKWC